MVYADAAATVVVVVVASQRSSALKFTFHVDHLSRLLVLPFVS